MPDNKNILIENEPSAPKRESVIGRTAHSILDGSFLTKDKIIRSFPFIFYLVFLILLYIANSYFAEKRLLAIEGLKKEMKELRFQYINSKSKLMFISQQSEVARRLEPSGVRESRIPPKKLVKNTKKN